MKQKAVNPELHATLLRCLKILLIPIARMCLHRSLRLQDAIEAMKHAFIEVAQEDIDGIGQEVNVSRLSATTGMHRRDVVRIFREKKTKDYSFNLINRIIGQWRHDPRFITKAHRPKILSVEGVDSDFKQLMNSVATDLKPGTVLFELERIGAIKHTPEGIQLIVETYQPGSDPVEGFTIVGDDFNDLLHATEDNIFEMREGPHLHAKTVYDNIAVEDLKKIKQWILKEGFKFHKRARQFLAKCDLDVNPRKESKGGARVVVGTFSRVASEPHNKH